MTPAPPSQFTLRGMLLTAAWVACACWLFILFPPCGLVMVALTVHLLLLRLDAWATWRRQRQGPPERTALIQFLRRQGAGQAARPHLQFSLRTMLLATAATGAFMSAAVAVTLKNRPCSWKAGKRASNSFPLAMPAVILAETRRLASGLIPAAQAC